MNKEMLETVETIKETILKVNNVGLYIEALAYSVALSDVRGGDDAGHDYRVKLLEILEDVYNAWNERHSFDYCAWRLDIIADSIKGVNSLWLEIKK